MRNLGEVVAGVFLVAALLLGVRVYQKSSLNQETNSKNEMSNSQTAMLPKSGDKLEFETTIGKIVADRPEAARVLELVGSGDGSGQQQRVAVPRAIAHASSWQTNQRPHSTASDRQVMELFAKVAHEQGAGGIVVTHDQRTHDVFDRIYEMEDGNMFESTHASHGVTKSPAQKSLETTLC